ncbi:thiazole biosynthesis protein ThiH [Catenovulum agarivorans DS-2]|uniref:Thiazole biosynthesis protein ThiH n=1 Tax=Catenovulum agarivorans DS-2 TaxID=1328313 RepID=W7QJM1_9ALTE|nr:2-iminoacetate synthase ThiH [Catenovulum agarivorans]EWH08338.1 thiazole biosynthesis protein ThiH [Catenovulum agarivorans DS-2]
MLVFNADQVADLADELSGESATSSSQIQQVLLAAKQVNGLSIKQFSQLLSPAAESFLPQMAQLSQHITQQRFGKNIQLYIPLYLSNWCNNICSYCGFSANIKQRRTMLDMAQIKLEAQAILAKGYQHILLVTGEMPKLAGVDYLTQVVKFLRPLFKHISLEVQPMSVAEYQHLKAVGVDAVLVYQETYHAQTYAQYHLKGKKADYQHRLETADRIAQAGIDKIGLGALLGLYNWRFDAIMLASHLSYLQKHYWRSRYSISFPRLRPCLGDIPQQNLVSEKQLLQLILAFRLFNPQVELSLSTRESAAFRDMLLPLGITTMSAESSTQPGGYAQANQAQLNQFDIDDNRNTQQITQVISQLGYQTVMQDWHASFSR